MPSPRCVLLKAEDVSDGAGTSWFTPVFTAFPVGFITQETIGITHDTAYKS